MNMSTLKFYWGSEYSQVQSKTEIYSKPICKSESQNPKVLLPIIYH